MGTCSAVSRVKIHPEDLEELSKLKSHVSTSRDRDTETLCEGDRKTPSTGPGTGPSTGPTGPIVLTPEQYALQRKIDRAMPPWCVTDPKVDAYTLTMAKTSWTSVTEGKGDPFRLAVTKNELLTPVVFFHDTFYNSFFDVSPDVKPLFKRGIKTQGQVLANILSFILSRAEGDPDGFVRILRHISVIHNQMGIESHYYSVVGQVLLMTLKKCLGDDLYTREVEYAWKVIYSKMMEVMIPVVVSGQKSHDRNTFYEGYSKVSVVTRPKTRTKSQTI